MSPEVRLERAMARLENSPLCVDAHDGHPQWGDWPAGSFNQTAVYWRGIGPRLSDMQLELLARAFEAIGERLVAIEVRLGLLPAGHT